jgi:predicted CopG family antitoxin
MNVFLLGSYDPVYNKTKRRQPDDESSFSKDYIIPIVSQEDDQLRLLFRTAASTSSSSVETKVQPDDESSFSKDYIIPIVSQEDDQLRLLFRTAASTSSSSVETKLNEFNAEKEQKG